MVIDGSTAHFVCTGKAGCPSPKPTVSVKSIHTCCCDKQASCAHPPPENSTCNNQTPYTTTRWSLLQLKSGPYHNRSQRSQNRTPLQPQHRIIRLPRDAPRPFQVFWSATLAVLLEWCRKGALGMLLLESWKGALGMLLLPWCWRGFLSAFGGGPLEEGVWTS